MTFSSGLDLAGHLLQLDDHEFGGLERRETDHDVDDAQVDVVLRGGFLVALDEVGILRRRALERALAEQVVHEVRVCVTPWTAAYQALGSMGFSRQEYWSGVPSTSSTNFCQSVSCCSH